ncbi:MAG: SNF2-related protein, partial [Bacteroidota bacterium]
METFFPAQRWTSEGEPELGVGVVIDVSNGRVQLFFPAADETRLYATASAPLRRVVFKVGDSIMDAEGQAIKVEAIEEEDGLFWYIGEGRRLSEVQLGDVSVQHGVEDLLLNGQLDSPHLFALRRETLQMDYHRRTSPVSGFIGGRIDLIPHQLYIGHEVSHRYAPRVLLSDEVGLGKTIEACLILHRLLLKGRISRVLILVPESLVHQWFVEMLRRFNLWFHIFDSERCEALEESAPDGNPFLDDQLIICSTAFLAQSPKWARHAVGAEWDMLVVDEAHHLHWQEDEVSPQYAVVEALSRIAKGLLLLTATPEQLGLESHFARLRLLDPDRYTELSRFREEVDDHQSVADLVESLSNEHSLRQAETTLLKSLVEPDKVEKLFHREEGIKEQIVEDLLDQHGPGRV